MRGAAASDGGLPAASDYAYLAGLKAVSLANPRFFSFSFKTLHFPGYAFPGNGSPGNGIAVSVVQSKKSYTSHALTF